MNARAEFNLLDEDVDVQVMFTADEFRDLSDSLHNLAVTNCARFLLEKQGTDATFISPAIDRAKTKALELVNAALDRKARADSSDE